MTTRQLNKTTIKPIIKFIGGWGGSMYGLNTQGARYYSFTLDIYNGKNSWQGGFDWWLDDALKYEQYAIELDTGKVFNQDKSVVLQLSDN